MNLKFGRKYPEDIKYNVCQIGKNTIHNFKFTDRKIQEIINTENLRKIQVSQGYSNCSIAVLNENSAITTDLKIAENLERQKINLLYLENITNIKLLDKNNKFSEMSGFIGGAVGKIDDKIIVFGDLSRIDEDNKIRKFIKQRKLEIIDFKGLDVIDYGGIITIIEGGE